MQRTHAIWIWRDDQGNVRYVGYGRFVDVHPALDKWNGRFTDNSELGCWLRDHVTEPSREGYGPRLCAKGMAQAAVMGLRQRYASPKLLKSRDPATWQGGGQSKAVFLFVEDDPELSMIFSSVRKAAQYVGVNASTMSRWCKSASILNYGYLDDV